MVNPPAETTTVHEVKDGPSQVPARRSALYGILTHEPRWGLSRRGLIVLLTSGTALSACFLLCIHPFLAASDQRAPGVLVVEGWVSKNAFEYAAREFFDGGYNQVIITFPWIRSPGTNDVDAITNSRLRRFTERGIPRDSVSFAFPQRNDRHRTYHSAIAVRKLLNSRLSDRNFTVLTEGVHARRSRLLFEKAFGTSVPVISVPPADYDPRRWWMYSEGIKEVVEESVAYLYTRCLFWPNAEREAAL